MVSASQSAIARPYHPISGRGGLVDRYFYLGMALLVAAIVVWGFSHSVDANLFHAAVPRPLLLWIHGAAFSTWVVFYILQSALVRTHNVRLHRTLGWGGAALGALMISLGISTAVVMGRFDARILHQPGVDAFLIVPFTDMLLFTTFLGLAIYWRRKPELHRRMMLMATCGLLAAAFGRVTFLADHMLFYWCVDAMILLGLMRDLVVNGSVHRVYRVALPVMIVFQVFVVHTMRSGSQWWLKIADAILG